MSDHHGIFRRSWALFSNTLYTDVRSLRCWEKVRKLSILNERKLRVLLEGDFTDSQKS